MRKVSTVVLAGVSAFCFGAAAAAQNIDFSASQIDLSPSQVDIFSPQNIEAFTAGQPAEFRVAPQATPVALDLATISPELTAQSIQAATLTDNGTMTVAATPGSGTVLDIPASPEAAMAASDTDAFSAGGLAGGDFTTAAGADSNLGGGFLDSGIRPMLGFDTTASLTTSFTPDDTMVPSVKLGQ